MKTSDYLSLAVASLERTSSPWRPELQQTLQHLVYVARRHEEFVIAEAPLDPPTPGTALGHKPRGITVTAHSTHTDAALQALDCSD